VRHSLKFMATTGVVATVGNDYNTVSIAYQRVFLYRFALLSG